MTKRDAKDEKKAPKLRFKGFTDDWEQRHFFDNIKKTIDFRGRTPKKLGMDWSKSGYLALSALNVKDGYIDYSADAHYANQKLYDKWMSGNNLVKGQVLFTTEAPMGNVAQVPDNKGYVLSQRTIAFVTNKDKITDDFLASILRTPQSFKRLSALSSGGTAKGVSQKSLSSFKLVIPPSLKEQEKIGKLFRSFEHTIYLHEEKQRQLEQLKKALLQKMFADKKEYPELRFNGFSDSWNKNKVSELFTITRGYVLPAKDTKPTPEGDYCYPVYSSQTAQNGLMGYYNKYLYKDAITWTTDGANAGTVRFRTGKFYCTNVCGVLLTKKAKASEMIAMALNKVTKKYVSYVGNPKLMNNVMGEIVISLPTNTEEQNNLSFLFNNLERAIILTEHKIEQLKSLKQALLQQMFI